MAEILGIVSGVITVTETAVKLGGSALKLKRLWEEVQGVPDMIKIYIEQLQILAPALDEMDYEFQQTRSIVQGDKAAKISLEYCRRAFDSLEKLIRDMESQILSARNGKRNFSKGKVMLKRHVISDYEKRLQVALQLVSLSQQAYTSALSRVRHSILMSEFQALEARSQERERCLTRLNQKDTDREVATNSEFFNRGMCKSKGSPTPSSRPNFRPLTWVRPGLLPWFSYEVFEVSDDNMFMTPTQAYRARFQLPDWLTRKAWDFQVSRAYDGWKFQLTPWSTRPSDSKVFSYVLDGDTDKLLAAFKTKEASLYDRYPNGQTLLGLAMFYPRFEIIEVLTRMGLSVKDIILRSPFFILDDTSEMNVNYASKLDLLRPLFEEDGPFSDEIKDILSCGRAPNETIVFMVWSCPGILDLIQLSCDVKLDLWITIDQNCWANPQVMLDILVNSNITPEQFRMKMPCEVAWKSFPLWYIFWEHYACMNGISQARNMRALGKWMFSGASISEVVKQFGEHPASFLQLLCLWCAYKVEDRTVYGRLFFKVTIRSWLEDLMEAGVDLEAYGQWEADRLLNPSWDEDSELYMASLGRRELGPFGPYVRSFEYGPRLEDWNIEYDPCIEEYAGEFWTLIGLGEELPGPIPGAWVEDGT